MEITFISPSFHPYVGGVETVLRETSIRLSRDKIKNVIITCRRSKSVLDYERNNKYQFVYRFDKLAPNNSYHFSMKMIPFLRSYSKKNETLYHIHSYHSLTSLNTRFFNSKPYIFSLYYHGGGHSRLANIFHVPYKLVAKGVLSNAEKIIAISKTERNNIIRNFPSLDQEKIALIPLGIDKKRIESIERKKGINFTIVYVGRVEEYKGIQYMVSAIKERNKKDIKLIIVGTGSYLSAIFDLIQKFQLREIIQIDTESHGEDVYKYYEYADIVFSFSYKETYGITIAEALTKNIPCLVPTIGALSEFIDNHICYGINKLDDMKEMNEKIDYILNNNLRKEKYRKKIYDWDDYYNSLKKLYYEIDL